MMCSYSDISFSTSEKLFISLLEGDEGYEPNFMTMLY